MRLARVTAAVVASGLALTGVSLSATGAPTLRTKTFVPFSVQGSSFKPGERVKVTVAGSGVVRTVAGSSLVARRVASPEGTFLARFPGIRVSRCDGYVVKARGSLGSVAVLRSKPLACGSVPPGGG